LNLRNHLEPVRRLQVHLKTKPVQKVGIIVSQLEAAVMIALKPESFLHSKSNPLGMLAVEQQRWSEIWYEIGRLRGEGPIGVAIQKTQRIRSRTVMKAPPYALAPCSHRPAPEREWRPQE
jgi:hypothetical protein